MGNTAHMDSHHHFSLFKRWLTRLARQSGEASRSFIGVLALSAMGLVGIAGYEGYSDKAIIPVPGDVPTVGFGTTQGVKLGDTTTPSKALRRLLSDADNASDGVRRCVTVPLTQGEFDAYVSLSYNIGTTAFCESTLVKLLNLAQYNAACAQILRWDKAGGKPLAGLTTRRRSEYLTCMGPAQ